MSTFTPNDDDAPPNFGYLSSTLLRASPSIHAINCPPSSILQQKLNPKASKYLTYAPESSLTFQFNNDEGDGGEKVLLSYVEIINGGCCEVDVFVGVEKGRRNMVKLTTSHPLPQNHTSTIPTGHVPLRFLTLTFRSSSSSSSSISLYNIRFNGIPCTNVLETMGIENEYLIYKATEKILYGPSLKMINPVAKPNRLKRTEVGGDIMDKSYSYLYPNTPATVDITPQRHFEVKGSNIARKHLDYLVSNLSSIKVNKFPYSPNAYDVLPTSVGGYTTGVREKPPVLNVPVGRGEVFIRGR